MNKELESKVRINFSKALNDFDFGTVHNVMNYLNWTWHGESTSPSKKHMIEMVEELFEDGITYFKNSSICIASGGFYIRIHETGAVEIQFVVKHSEADE